MNTNKVIIGTDGQQRDMNGLPVSLRGTTAYKNVYFGDAGFQNNGQEVFVALVGLTEEERQLTGKKSYLHHLSKHDNVLDAAYVAMKFNEDRAANIEKLKSVKTGEWECELPVFKFEALEFNGQVAKTSSKPKTFKARVMKPKAVATIDDRSADKFFEVLFSKYDIQALVKKFGRDVVLTARKVLTINEFEMRFGL